MHTASGGGYDSVAAVDLVVTVSDITNVPDVPDQHYILNNTVYMFLPETTGAPGPLTYALEGDIPDGLTFDPTTRIISGTPIQKTPGTTLIYTVTDSAGNQYSRSFLVIVSVVTTADIARMNDRIMPRASQAINANTLEVVAARVKSAAGGGGGAPAPAYQFGGQSSVSGLLKSHGEAILEGTMEYESLLDNASFVLPLRAGDDGNAGGIPVMWGTGNYHNLKNDNDEFNWDGRISSTNFGVDTLLGEDRLAGVALSWHQGRFDYRDAVIGSGEYDYTVSILSPYFGWFPHDGFSLWAMAGYGEGEIDIEIEEDIVAERSADTSQWSFSGGMKGRFAGPVPELSVKATVALVRVTVDETTQENIPLFEEQDIDSGRLRLLLVGDCHIYLSGGQKITQVLEAGVRYDKSDVGAEIGTEVGGVLHYTNAARSLTMEGKMRALESDEYDELGVDFILQLSPPDGRGLSLRLHPAWGQTQSTAEQLWDDGASELGGGEPALGSMDTEIGYGVSVSMLGTAGVLTPFAGLTAEDGGSNRPRLGGRFSGDRGLSLSLEGTQDNAAEGARNNTLLLRGEVEF